MIKKLVKRKRNKLAPEEIERRKQQREQKKEIRDIFKRVGFKRLLGIDGKEFNYDSRTGELDDIFVCENVIILTEYTIGEPGTHLIKKKILYDKINNNISAFLKFLVDNKVYDSFTNEYENALSKKYTINQLVLRILYCSKKIISQEHKQNVNCVVFFDDHIVKYFKSLTTVIKLSSRYEFLDFLEIN